MIGNKVEDIEIELFNMKSILIKLVQHPEQNKTY